MGYPFKFNRAWLESPEYTSLISNSLMNLLDSDSSDSTLSLRDKMVIMRQITKNWQLKKKKDRLMLHDLQDELDQLIGSTCTYALPNIIRSWNRDL